MNKLTDVTSRSDYLTLDEITGGKLTLDELLDAPWTHDGRSLRQDARETFGCAHPQGRLE